MGVCINRVDGLLFVKWHSMKKCNGVTRRFTIRYRQNIHCCELNCSFHPEAVTSRVTANLTLSLLITTANSLGPDQVR